MTKSIFITSGDGGPRWLPPPGPVLITLRPTGALLRNDEMYGGLFLKLRPTARGNMKQSHQGTQKQTHTPFFLGNWL